MKLYRGIIGLPLLLATAGVHAQVEQALDRCTRLLDDTERLECFEDVAAGARKPAAAPQRGKLSVKKSKNPFDDSDTVLLTLSADAGASPDGKAVVLVLRCESGDTDAYINWHTPLRKDREDVEVLYRIGNAAAVTEEWRVSTNNTATFFAGDDERFIESLLRAPQLVAQVVPANATPIRAEFDLAGLGDAIQPLRQTCGW
ncbi:MAG TPA: type VI secretion system-associated protein TagO [Gammaproteobacteria bacterium]|nr:type VI secretion system-associated protein TagO [Gammaproteobacteria bacterium]